MRFDVLFCCDDYARRDDGDATCLVAQRSDPPPHDDFDQLLFLSRHHAELMGHPGRPAIGNGVTLEDYATTLPRIPDRILCTVSPDRAPAARTIGEACGDFVHTYKPVPGYKTIEVSREELICHQKQAKVFIYPYDPVRESDFWSMATCEAMAAGTPCVIADGRSHVELWGEASVVLPRPTDLGAWYEAVTGLLTDPVKWKRYSRLGRATARKYAWPDVARRYVEAVWQ